MKEKHIKIRVNEAIFKTTIGEGDVYYKAQCSGVASKRSVPGERGEKGCMWRDGLGFVLPVFQDIGSTKLRIQVFRAKKKDRPECIGQTTSLQLKDDEDEWLKKLELLSKETGKAVGEVEVDLKISERRRSPGPEAVPMLTSPALALDLLSLLIAIVSIFSWVNVLNSMSAFSLCFLLMNCSFDVLDMAVPCAVALAGLRTLVSKTVKKSSKHSYAKSEIGRNSLVGRLVALREHAKSTRNQAKIESFLTVSIGQTVILLFMQWRKYTRQIVTVSAAIVGIQLKFGVPLWPMLLCGGMVVFPFVFSWSLLKDRMPFLPEFTNLTPAMLSVPIVLYEASEEGNVVKLPSREENGSVENLTLAPPATPLKKIKTGTKIDPRDVSPDLGGFTAFSSTIPASSPPLRKPNHHSVDLGGDVSNHEREGSVLLDDAGTPPPTGVSKRYTTQSGVYCGVVMTIPGGKEIFSQIKDLQEKKAKAFETGKIPRHEVTNAACTVLLSLVSQQTVKYRVSKGSQANRYFMVPEMQSAVLAEADVDVKLTHDKSVPVKHYFPLNEERDLSVGLRAAGGRYARGKVFEKELEEAVNRCHFLQVVNKGFRQPAVTSDEHEKDVLVALSYVAAELFSNRVSMIFRTPTDQSVLVFVTKVFPPPSVPGRLSFPDDYRPDLNRDIVPPALLRQLVVCSCRMPTSLTVLSDQIAKVKYQYYRSSEMVHFTGDVIKKERSVRNSADLDHSSETLSRRDSGLKRPHVTKTRQAPSRRVLPRESN
eukprot:TRINITY_DN1529_c0_g5_i1.p1 TRINITY_DN1529_c0_g5~~TRINITY_DN1529_c0_g5_i1.p1  ORF type:complete len:791 (+),score=126.24 TRINITY_DN1529_c0_g5_i1:82-2373(+)